jgi:hypothetical protein
VLLYLKKEADPAAETFSFKKIQTRNKVQKRDFVTE